MKSEVKQSEVKKAYFKKAEVNKAVIGPFKLIVAIAISLCTVSEQALATHSKLDYQVPTQIGVVHFYPKFSAGQTAPAKTPDVDQQKVIPSNLETCFSPEERCDEKLISLIDSAQSTVEIAIFSITNPGIANAINNAFNRGLKVRMVVDRSESGSQSSKVGALLSKHIPLRFGNTQGIMHNKFTIIDNQMVETGSYNYSVMATSSNEENQIYLSNPSVVNRFRGDFEKLWARAYVN